MLVEEIRRAYLGVDGLSGLEICIDPECSGDDHNAALLIGLSIAHNLQPRCASLVLPQSELPHKSRWDGLLSFQSVCRLETCLCRHQSRSMASDLAVTVANFNSPQAKAALSLTIINRISEANFVLGLTC